MWDTIISIVIETFSVIKNIVPDALAYTAPLLVIALGGLYSERSGIVNIGLEGLLGIGAFFSALYISNNMGIGTSVLWVGLLIGAFSGGIFALLHAFASVTMKANQVISGTAINMLSAALTIFLARKLTGSSNVNIGLGFVKKPLVILGLDFSKIPIIGPLVFEQFRPTLVLVLVLLIISWYILYKTPFGLRLRACGENPHAADSMGINVSFMRYFGVAMSGVLAGLGGAIIIVTIAGEFSSGAIYNGLGFLALAALIFGKWKPFGILGAALFFGTANTISTVGRLYPAIEKIPNIFLNTFPYIVTLIALVLFSKNSSGPKAAGEPYDKGKR